MALLPTTGLENHPVGTTGLNGIINGNWETLEAIFLPLATATTAGRVAWNPSTKKFSLRAALAAITYSGTPVLNMGGAVTQTLALTGNATFTTTGLIAGGDLRVVITADASLRTLAWPGGWKWIGGTAPANIAANKTAILELISTSAADSGVVARWTVEP